jgi:hypothetical protein
MTIKRRKKNLEITIEKPELRSPDAAVDTSLLEKAVKKAAVQMTETSEKFVVISRLNNPTYLQYDGEMVMVSPRAKLVFGDYKKLGKLPDGLVTKKIK